MSSSAVSRTADDKVAQIVQKYEDANAEIADLESRVRQKESEVKVQTSENTKKQDEVNRLKGEIAGLTQEQTMLTTTLKHLKTQQNQQIEQRAVNYNKMVAVEEAIKATKENDKQNLREHNKFFEDVIRQKLLRRESLLQRMQRANDGVGASSASSCATTTTTDKVFAAAMGLRLLANSEIVEETEGGSASMNDDANEGMDNGNEPMEVE